MIRRSLSSAVLFAAALLIGALPARADIFEEPMVFVLAENSRHDLQWIAAIGTITRDTPAAFDKFARAIQREGMWVEFSSPGGDVAASLRLGEMIRRRGFNTDVGFTVLHGNGKDALMPGYCISACGYAFLGGVKRDVQEGSVLGYHQFYLADPEAKVDPETDAAVTTMLTRYIALYLRRMGVGARLLPLALATKPTDYYEPDSDERIELHIVTEDEQEAETKPEITPPNAMGKRSDVRGPAALAPAPPAPDVIGPPPRGNPGPA
jgi:hypothetical protein